MLMDIIETPKIDRLHRLGAVSLKIRAGLEAGDGNSSLWDHPPPIVLPDPVLLPSKEAPSRCQHMQRVVTGLMHSGLVGYVGFGPSCKVPPPILLGCDEPCSQLRLRGAPKKLSSLW